jgi:acyl-CoA synthetase (NDP forming)
MGESAPAQLWAGAFPLEHGRAAVPEHQVKAALAELGIRVPDGRTTDSPAGAGDAGAGLVGPLVLKAWGPGLVHKSDVGAVRLGLDAGSVGAAALEMDRDLRARGITPAGFLVEEQQPPGVELIVGVLNRPDFGPVVLLGVGGTWTEVIDQAVVRLVPLDEAGAWEMLASFPGAPLLDGLRGAPPVDQAAIVSVLLAVAGPGGLAERLGSELAELECNPVIATPKGAVVVDARLIHAEVSGDAGPAPMSPAPSLDLLFAPRTIGVIGASTSKLAFGNRFLRGYTRRGWDSGLYAIHPQADEVEGVPAVPSVADIPGGLDYLLVAVPAAACADVIRQAAGRVAFAQVMSGGFREEGASGARLEQELLVAARQAGVRVVGPNCMGIYSPKGRQTWQLRDPIEAGRVSVVSQSGGLAGDIIKGGEARGVLFSKLATVGNAVDVTPGELVEYFLEDPDTEVIGLYLEGARDGARLLSALRRARGRKPVTILVGALSTQGALAAASHTGSMTGDARVWDAISRATGTAVVKTLEELLGTLAFQQRYAATAVADDPGVLIIGPGGGASILGADACDRAGLFLDPVAAAAQRTLRSLGYGAGTSVANPIEIGIGPAAAADAFDPILDAILEAQPYPDVLLHFNVQSFYSQGDTGCTRLVEMLERLAAVDRPSRLAIVLRNLDCAPPADVAVVRNRAQGLGLPSFINFDEAMTAIRAAKLFTAAAAVR